MKILVGLILIALVGVARAGAPRIIAHLSGQNYGKVETNIVVSVEEKIIFHLHSDCQGGGTWYDAFISIKDGDVTIVERDSVSGPYKTGHKVNTTETTYRLPVEKIGKDEIALSHGNRIVLASKREENPAAGRAVSPSVGASGGP